MVNTFTTKDGYEYFNDDFGVIHQVNPQPYKYDSSYVNIYKSPQYREFSALLMGIRLGSVYSTYLSNFPTQPQSIVDIGYGDGSFIKTTEKLFEVRAGYDVTDEPTPINVKKEDDINNMGFYDIITMWDVYEHLPNLDLIKNLNFNLICFSMPDVTNKDFEGWKHRKPNEHIHHFTPKSLENLMNSYGLKKVHLSWQEDTVRKGDEPNNIMTLMFIKD